MRSYALTRVFGKPDWNTIPSVAIDHYLWSDVRSITASAQVAWDEEALYVRLQAQEKDIRRIYTGEFDPVCEDSCLEFFFCPEEKDHRYFNFEANPNGALYVGFGGLRHRRCRLHRPDFKTLFQVQPFETPGVWGIELRIPVSFIQIFDPGFQLYPGKIIRGNFYKCGDKTAQPHFMSWNRVGTETPDFHQPDYFGQLTL